MGIWVVGIYAVSLYILFLSEGGEPQATQLHRADPEGVLDLVDSDTGSTTRKKSRFKSF